MTSKEFVWLALGGILMTVSGALHAFGFDDVSLRAKKLAATSYQGPDRSLPAGLKELNYDEYRDIRFKPEMALWRAEKLPFEVAFFHRGGYFLEPVKISEITGKAVKELKFDATRFSYGANRMDTSQFQKLGFAGFRLHFPLNTPAYKDELVSFLGASYFRALGATQWYGLSARGLAVDTARSSGEEFPRFTEFWLERPSPAAKQITIYALLDSRRVAGAYRFVLTPGNETLVDVKARIFLRDKVDMVGIAPLTSMFLFGENQAAASEDYRPEVHDSDGLSVSAASGEWLWRPLQNPKRLLVTSFALKNPKGFGLMQRDREFDHYEDLEARYERRPSVWIEPKGNWGTGRVELVQIPVPDETNDNIVAYWVADTPLQPGVARDFEYRMRWQKNKETLPPTAFVLQTRRGHGYVKTPDDSISLHVDFDGPALRKLAINATPKSTISADDNGQIVEKVVHRNEATGGWRLSLRVRRIDPARPVEMRAQLIGKDNLVSETWSYILPPE